MSLLSRIQSFWVDKDEAPALETKTNKGVAVFINGSGIEELPDADLKRIAMEGYKKNPFVKAAVRLRANAVASLPYILVKTAEDGKTWERVYRHDILSLLEKPNPRMGKTGLFYHLEADLAQFGQCFLHPYKPSGGVNRGRVANLYPLKAVNTTVRSGTMFRPIQEFIYEEFTRVTYRPDEIIYICNYSPTSEWYGESDAYAVGNSIDLSNMQILWNKNLLKNKGVPPYYLSSDGYISEADAEKIATMAHNSLSGAMNAGKPFVTFGGLKIEKLGLSSTELDWLKGMQEVGRQILMGMGVRPELAMFAENVNAGNLKSAERQFYIQTVLPEAQLILDAINNQLISMFPDSENMKLIIDKDQVLALTEDIESVHKRVRADYAVGLASRNEGRDELDWQPVQPDRIVELVNVSQVGSDISDDARQRANEQNEGK